MNIADYIIIGILAISVIYGLYRGFLRTVLNLLCLLVALTLAFTFSGRLAELIRSNEQVSMTLATYTDSVARVGDYDLAQTEVSQDLPQQVIQTVLDSVSLPGPIASILRKNLESASFSGTRLTTVNDYVQNTVVASAISVLSFILCFIAAYAVLSILMSLIYHIFKFPVLRVMDSLAGGAFGLVRALLLLYLLFLLVPILSTVIPIDTFNEVINQSKLAPLFTSDGFFAGVIRGKLF